MTQISKYTKEEEKLNAISHFIGIVVGVVVGWIFVSAASEHGSTPSASDLHSGELHEVSSTPCSWSQSHVSLLRKNYSGAAKLPQSTGYIKLNPCKRIV